MTCNEDFEDALRCVEPIPNYDDACRLTIRIDDSLTPALKSPAKKKPCIIIKDGLSTKTTSAKGKSEDPNFSNSKSKKRLNFHKNEFEFLNMNLRAIKKLSNTKRLYRGTSLLVKPKSTLNFVQYVLLVNGSCDIMNPCQR